MHEVYSKLTLCFSIYYCVFCYVYFQLIAIPEYEVHLLCGSNHLCLCVLFLIFIIFPSFIIIIIFLPFILSVPLSYPFLFLLFLLLSNIAEWNLLYEYEAIIKTYITWWRSNVWHVTQNKIFCASCLWRLPTFSYILLLIHRYSGRTQKQVQEFVRDNYVKRAPFQRYCFLSCAMLCCGAVFCSSQVSLLPWVSRGNCDVIVVVSQGK